MSKQALTEAFLKKNTPEVSLCTSETDMLTCILKSPLNITLPVRNIPIFSHKDLKTTPIKIISP